MKLAMVLLSLSLSSAYASSYFDCRSTSTGISYKAYPQYGEIHVTDRAGREIISLDGLRASTTVYESYPPLYVTRFLDEGNLEVMEVSYRGNQMTGSFDDDEDLVCVYRK